jgi:hypothetical protein
MNERGLRSRTIRKRQRVDKQMLHLQLQVLERLAHRASSRLRNANNVERGG